MTAYGQLCYGEVWIHTSHAVAGLLRRLRRLLKRFGASTRNWSVVWCASLRVVGVTRECTGTMRRCGGLRRPMHTMRF